ncbi:multiple monosaccharide-binding protein [Methylobacterium sp. UNC300MFChir4.1]|uniref:multiple monosaccharide ABC transporter substrate-binding protein n=1 Tax=Methylobacterium sp. UNC300MFChir4.1 TaxID=1502747 RepID=UPI0008B58874|nr:multiple monosaccharide ABC transporter substrate-binding protein [Methylobacterium sp. UNC300MFChir4.1]SEO39518.1 multiple monosaccharide-binding protein [Methylobacterium sp. UNC300MFChir4.1]
MIARQTVLKYILGLSLLGVSAATSAQAAGGDPIGVAMPTKSSQRWIDDGNNIVRLLKAKGYKPDLQYADDDIPTQLAQIENMLTTGVKILVIASIDGTTLSDVLSKASERGVRVIAYDRLIRETPNVDYYATFDNYKVGVQQATSIVDALGLKDGKAPFNIELFGGSPDDNNAYFFYDGALSVLKPYLDAKRLVVRSGQFGMDKVSTLRWDAATAQARMDNLLSAYYGNAHLDAVLSPYDGISTAILSSVKSVGYGSGGVKLPVISGQDAELQSVKSIIAGEQTATIFKDTRDLAKVTVAMIDAIQAGRQPEVNDVKTYDNGKKIVPSYLLTPVIVTRANWKPALIDTGYYTLDQLK